MSINCINYGEIKPEMSESRKEWIKTDQWLARKSFYRNPYAGTIAEVCTDRGEYEESEGLSYVSE